MEGEGDEESLLKSAGPLHAPNWIMMSLDPIMPEEVIQVLP